MGFWRRAHVPWHLVAGDPPQRLFEGETLVLENPRHDVGSRLKLPIGICTMPRRRGGSSGAARLTIAGAWLESHSSVEKHGVVNGWGRWVCTVGVDASSGSLTFSCHAVGVSICWRNQPSIYGIARERALGGKFPMLRAVLRAVLY